MVRTRCGCGNVHGRLVGHPYALGQTEVGGRLRRGAELELTKGCGDYRTLLADAIQLHLHRQPGDRVGPDVDMTDGRPFWFGLSRRPAR